MAKLRKIWDSASAGSTIWALLPSTWQTAITTGAGVVTAYFGFEAGGIFYALLGGAGMFLIATAGAYYAILLNRQVSIFERIGIDQITIVQAAMIGKGSQEKPDGFLIRGLTLEVHIKNHSERNIWTKIKREHHSIANQTTESPPYNVVNVIPAHGFLKILLATLPDISLGAERITGTVDLEILYGPDKDDLRYLFLYISKPALGIQIDTGSGSGQLNMAIPITKNEHERV